MQSRSKSPVRGNQQTQHEVFLLSTEQNEARALLEDKLRIVLSQFNETFSKAEIRLLPMGPNDRDREYYIFPFLYHELHSVGFLEEFIRSKLESALEGRAVQIRMLRDNALGESQYYIDIATRKPKARAETEGTSWPALIRFILFILIALAGLIGSHQYVVNAHPD